MGSLSAIGGASGAWSSASAFSAQRSARQAQQFAKVDSDGSGGVSATELDTVLKDIGDKIGVSLSDTQRQDLFKAMDGDSSGDLSSDELAQGMEALRPPPSTLEFAQRHGGGPGPAGGSDDDLFAKVDGNGDGTLDSDELSAFAEQVKTDTGNDISDALSALDADQSGGLSATEFAAGRPSGPPPGGMGGAGPAGGPPPMGPPPGAAPATADQDDDDDTTTVQGTASADSELSKLVRQLYQQASEAWATSAASGSTGVRVTA